MPQVGEGEFAARRTVADLGVLVVDDDPVSRRVISRMLVDLDARGVWGAANGVEALDVLRRVGDRVDVVLCDLDMPVMGGLDLLHALRTAAGNPLACLPVVVLTGHRDADTVKRAISYGISGYLVKPVTSADLVKRLESLALRRR